MVTFYYKGIITVHFRVGEDSTGLGEVSEPIDVDVYKGTTAVVNGNVITLSYGGKQAAVDVATPIDTEKYTRSFDLWNNATGDRNTDYVKTILEETWYYAHFDEEINTFPVHFRVASDSTGLGNVSTAAGEKIDYVEVPYDTVVTIDSDGKVVLSDGSNSTPKAIEKAGYDVAFTQWNGADDLTAPTVSVITGETWFWAHFVEDIHTFPVHFRVASDSTGLGNVSTDPGELTDYHSVPYGTAVAIINGKVVLSDGSNSTPEAAEKAGYTVTFTQWNGADDRTTPTVKNITGETWFWAHFDTRGLPVQVEIKYLSNGAPIQIEGKNLDWVSASYYGNDVSINYKQNFSAEVASKLDAAYTLTKGFINMPAGHPDADPALDTVEYDSVDTQRIIIQFEFDKNATYMQRYMVYADGASLPFPVAEMPEAYGLDATVTVTATDPADVPKTAKVRIGDAAGTFYGVGQTGTYHGHAYKVVQGDSGRPSDVKVLIDGEINVCDQKGPLPFYYQFV